jgi:hypothetical protein
MEDSKCMICKQDCPRVFFTRYMGDYTEGLAPDEFDDLPVRSYSSRGSSAQLVADTSSSNWCGSSSSNSS